MNDLTNPATAKPLRVCVGGGKDGPESFVVFVVRPGDGRRVLVSWSTVDRTHDDALSIARDLAADHGCPVRDLIAEKSGP